MDCCKIENLVVSTVRNVWGWYTADAFIDGFLISVKFDTKPTKNQAKQALIAKYTTK